MEDRKPNQHLWNRRQLLQLTGGMAAAWALSACAPAAAPVAPQSAAEPIVDQPQQGGTLRVAFPGSAFTLDPILIFSYEEIHFAESVYEGLTRMGETGIVQPGLAESWQEAEDGLSWVFNLRQGVEFHHGTPFTAADVVHTINRILDASLGSSATQLYSFIAGAEAVDDATVRLDLHSPNVDLPGWLSMWMAVITPQDRTDDQLATEPSGTGPFLFSEFVPGERLVLSRNENYWQEGLPYLDSVQMLYMPDTTTQIAALTSGTVDLIWQVHIADVTALQGAPDVTVQETPSSTGVVITMRTDQAPFDDVRVRQALKHCVDRSGMVQAVLQGHGVPGNDQISGPDDLFWADVPALEYDIDKARALLADAGYADGLDVVLYVQNFRSYTMETAVALQEMVKPAGINIQLEPSTPGDFWSSVYMQAPFYVVTNFPYPAFDITYSTTYHSDGIWNDTFWANPETDQLINEGRSEGDETKRREIYAAAQELASQEGGHIVPFFRPVFNAARSTVNGVIHTPLDMISFHKVWLTQA